MVCLAVMQTKGHLSQDSSYCLLTSLEFLDEQGNLKRKADIFTKRTIRHAQAVTSVDTASEALAVSIGEKAQVDLAYMSQLTGKTEAELTEELTGVIFRNPLNEKWEPSDEYLSGNVREKLKLPEDLPRTVRNMLLMYNIWNECSQKTWMPQKLKQDLVQHGFLQIM